jgi:hypothetical protein
MKNPPSMAPSFRGWLAIGFAVAPLIFLFAWLHRPELERTVPVALIVIIGLIKVCRDYRKHVWFWITVSGIAAIHVPMISLSAKYAATAPFGALLLAVVLDGLLMLAIVEGVAWMSRNYWAGGTEKPSR